MSDYGYAKAREEWGENKSLTDATLTDLNSGVKGVPPCPGLQSMVNNASNAVLGGNDNIAIMEYWLSTVNLYPDTLEEFAGIYYDKNKKDDPGFTKAEFISYSLQSFSDQRALGGENYGGGAGAFFRFFIALNAMIVAGASYGTTIQAQMEQEAQGEFGFGLKRLFLEILEENLIEDTYTGSYDETQPGSGDLQRALEGKAALDADFLDKIKSSNGSVSGGSADDQEESKVEEGDLITYSQCALMYDFIRNDNLQSRYVESVLNRKIANTEQFRQDHVYSGRVIPLWVNYPEKFINYCNFAQDYGDFFKNLSFPDGENFSTESKTEINSTDYANYKLTTELNFIYRDIKKNAAGVESETLIDLPIRLNSKQGETIDFMMLNLASEVVKRAGTSSDKDTYVRTQTGGIFETYKDAENYASSTKTITDVTTADAPAGDSLRPGSTFIACENINIKFDGTNPSTARKDVEVEITWNLDSYWTFINENIAKPQTGDNVAITLADLISLPITNKKVSGQDVGSYLKSQYSPNYNRLQVILKSNSRVQLGEEVWKEISKTEYNKINISTQKKTSIDDEQHARASETRKVTTSSETKKESGKYYKKEKVSISRPANDLVIDLAIVDHTLERESATGFLTLKLSYRGYFDSMLSAPSCDSLADSDIYNRRVKRDKLLREAVNQKCSREEIKRLMQINNNIAQQEKKRSLKSILKRLTREGRIYHAEIPTKWVVRYINDGAFPTLESNDWQRSIVDFNRMFGLSANTDEQIDNLIEGQGTIQSQEDQAVEDGDDGSDVVTNNEQGFKTWAFFLGDLLEVIGDGLYENHSSEHRGAFRNMNMKFMATTFSIDNLTNNIAEDDRIKHILAVPIGLEFFVQWFNENVVNKDLIYYPMGTMIKDLVERTISSLLYETCFSDVTDTPPLFRLMYMTDCRTGGDLRSYSSAHSDIQATGHILTARTIPNGPNDLWGKDGFYLDVEKWLSWETGEEAGRSTARSGCRPFFYQNSKIPTSERENYCVIYCMQPMILNRKTKYDIKSDKDSFDKFVPVINYGSRNTSANYLSDVKFSKTNTPGLRESRYFSSMNGSLSLLSNVYDLSFRFSKRAGNTVFFPGQLIDFRLLDYGLGSPHEPGSKAFHLGLGGYHIVKSVSYDLNPGIEGDFAINVEAKFLDTKASKQFSRVDDEGELKVTENPRQAECDLLLDRAERILQGELSNLNTDGVYNSLGDTLEAMPDPPPPPPEEDREEEEIEESDPVEIVALELLTQIQQGAYFTETQAQTGYYLNNEIAYTGDPENILLTENIFLEANTYASPMDLTYFRASNNTGPNQQGLHNKAMAIPYLSAGVTKYKVYFNGNVIDDLYLGIDFPVPVTHFLFMDVIGDPHAFPENVEPTQ